MITQIEREAYRKGLKEIKYLRDLIEQHLSRGKPLSDNVMRVVTTMTGTTEPARQYEALKQLYHDLDAQYDEELRFAAQFQLSPFCEYMNRDQIPVKHHEFLINHMESVHTGDIQRLAISMPPGAAKSLAKYTVLNTISGSKKLGDIVIGDRVLTHTGQYKKVTHIHEHLNNEALEIETVSGIKVTCSPDHTWMTGKGWKEAGDLRPKDYLAIPKDTAVSSYYIELFNECGTRIKCSTRNERPTYLRLDKDKIIGIAKKLRRGNVNCRMSRSNCKGRRKLHISPDEHDTLMLGEELFEKLPILTKTTTHDLEDFMLTGLLIGDGCVTDKTRGFKFTQGSKIIFDLYTEIAGTKVQKKMKGSYVIKKNSYTGGSTSKEARKYLEYIELKGNAYTKKIPQWVYKGDEACIGALLAGLMMTDGSIFPQKAGKNCKSGSFRAKYSSVSESLINGFIELCSLLGINCSKDICNSTYKGEPYRSYNARLTSRVDIVNFFTKCPVIGPKRDRFEELMEQFGGVGSVDTALYSNEEIYSITPVNNVDMRCLTVEDDHTFVVEGIVTHNSTYASHLFPAWHLGRRPDDRWLQGAHTMTFAKDRLGKVVRGLISEQRYRDIFPDMGISSTSAAADYFEFTNGGGYFKAVGVGTGIAGYRFEMGAIDDPIASREDAESPTFRRKLHSWFEDDFGTRPSNPKAPIYIVSTRWHEDDLVGHEIQKMKEGKGEEWIVLNIPALAEEDDPLGREVGEGLWPEHYGTEFYLKRKRVSTGRSWNSMYQGHPTDEEGGVLKREDVSRYTKTPKNIVDTEGNTVKKVIKRVTLSVDCAEKATERSDYTAATVWVESGEKKHYLIHAARIKKEFTEMVQWIEQIARTYKVDQILVEDRGAGTQYIQVRKTSMGYAPVIPIATKQQSKAFRFDGITPMFAAGEVFLPETGLDWIADLEAEIFAFPAGRNDDYVDTISQYLAYSRDNNVTRGTRKLLTY